MLSGALAQPQLCRSRGFVPVYSKPSCRWPRPSRVQSNAWRCQCQSQDKRQGLVHILGKALVGVAASALLALPLPATAAIETVPASVALEQARPLPPQQPKKGEVWLVFLLGAAGLFGATLLLENNETFFPAIAKANKAMALTRKQQQAGAAEDEAVVDTEATQGAGMLSTEEIQEARMQAAVEAGLHEARARTEQQQQQPEEAPSTSDSSEAGHNGSAQRNADSTGRSSDDALAEQVSTANEPSQAEDSVAPADAPYQVVSDVGDSGAIPIALGEQQANQVTVSK